MSTGVTVTRTITTSDPNAIIINTGYVKVASGLLKLLQLILGGIAIFFLLKNYFEEPYYRQDANYDHYYYFYKYGIYIGQVLTLLILATVFFILTAILLLSCLFSLSTGGLISKTLYEFVYHLNGFILLLIGSIILFVKIQGVYQHHLRFYNDYLVATILCFVNSLLYLASTIVAYREYRY